MVGRQDGKRNFALRTDDGSETSVFSGGYPRQAALKAARRIDTVGDSEEAAPRVELRLRERGTDKVHIYEGWAWETEPDENAPDWLASSDSVTEANVSKQRIKHLEDD